MGIIFKVTFGLIFSLFTGLSEGSVRQFSTIWVNQDQFSESSALSSVLNYPKENQLSTSNPLFEGDDILEVTLEMDHKTVLRDRGDETNYHPLTISWMQEESTPFKAEALVKVRGNFRRKKSNCRFPPLRIKFDPDKVIGTVFEGQKKLKLVTHCQTKKGQYEQYLLQEYLIYRSYNLITEKSFKVRLLKITYNDINNKSDSFTRHGFFIEDEDKMAERLGGNIIEVKNVHPDQTEYGTSNLLSVFEYMVGNTDWSISGLHNVKLVMPDNSHIPIPVPYDFDWSGIVNARYARPNPILKIRSVRDRLFRGFCRTSEEFQEVFNVFNSKKEAIFSLYQTHSPILENAELDDALEYLNEFYEIINDEKKASREIINQCRTDR